MAGGFREAEIAECGVVLWIDWVVAAGAPAVYFAGVGLRFWRRDCRCAVGRGVSGGYVAGRFAGAGCRQVGGVSWLVERAGGGSVAGSAGVRWRGGSHAAELARRARGAAGDYEGLAACGTVISFWPRGQGRWHDVVAAVAMRVPEGEHQRVRSANWGRGREGRGFVGAASWGFGRPVVVEERAQLLAFLVATAAFAGFADSFGVLGGAVSAAHLLVTRPVCPLAVGAAVLRRPTPAAPQAGGECRATWSVAVADRRV